VIFGTDRDFLQYAVWKMAQRIQQEICLGYLGLLSHEHYVHFICVPGQEDSLSRTFNLLHMRYSQYLNHRWKMIGHVWRGRFYSTILDEPHVYAAVRYVENNPVRAGIVKKPEAYRWASAREHVKGSSDGIVSQRCYLLKEISDWRKYLQEEEDGNLVDKIRKCSLTGRSCGHEAFVEMLEQRLSRRLKALPQGRPKKGK
jgi:putative transposase